MRVCLVTTAFPRWENDSLGTFIYEAAQALIRQGIIINVVAMHTPDAETHETRNGIEVNRPRYMWPESLEVLQKYKGGLPIFWSKELLARLIILPFMIAHTLGIAWHTRKADLIHAHWSLSALCVWLSRPFHRKPFVVTVQGSDIYQGAKIPLIKLITRLALNQADYVLALSHSLAVETRAMGITSPILIMPNGVNTSEFVPDASQRQPIILFVGSLITRKGVNFLIMAMSTILETYPNYQLVIVGDGPLRNELERLVSKLNLTNNVEFVGDLSPKDVRVLMQKSQVFVLPSIEEGQGVVILEALACGLPCVGSAVGGIPEMIRPDLTGVLVPPGDAVSIASGIDYILSNPSRWQRMSSNARRIAVAEYDWDKIAQRLVSIYRQIIL